MTSEYLWKVAIPKVALMEATAKHKRMVEDVESKTRNLLKERRRLGLPADLGVGEKFDYLDFIGELLEEKVIGFEILSVPTADHVALVERAIARKPPFNEKGSGYRDSLIWESVKEVAALGHDVAFVSHDNVFAGDLHLLAESLATEVESLAGTVTLVRDLGSWLVQQLPWESETLADAVAEASEAEFHKYLMESDALYDLVPPLYVLNLPYGATNVELESVDWDTSLERISRRSGPGGSVIAEFDVGLTVFYRADVSGSATLIDFSATGNRSALPATHMRADTGVIARLTVLFDVDGQWIDEISYRPHGTSGDIDYSLYRPHEDQIPMFDL